MRPRTLAAIAAALWLATTLIPNPDVQAARAPVQDSLPACVTEDSDNCYWDADVQGNGIGASFYTLNGVTTYLP